MFKTIIRKLSGAAAIAFFVLILGTAGKSDLGAPLEKVISAAILYTGLFVASFILWKILGENEELHIKEYEEERVE